MIIPDQRDYGEGHVLFLSQRIFDLKSAYKPLDGLPYVVCPYTPLYMLAARLANVLVGDPLLAGRALSLVSTLGISTMLVFIVLGTTSVRAPMLCRAASAAFAGVLPLMSESVAGWATLMRVDMLALFLMYGGLGVYLAAGKRERWQHAAGALFVLALFTKETMLSAPLACIIFGLLMDRRRTLRVCAGAAALLAAGVVCANAVTHGGFLTNILKYNQNPFSWKTAAVHVYHHARACWPWLTVAGATVLALWNPVAIRRSGWREFLEARSATRYGRAVMVGALNCVFAAALTVTIGKMGSTYNYFLAWDISTCLLCGLFLYRILATWTNRRNLGRAAAWACALLLFGLLLPPASLLAWARNALDPPRSSPADGEVLRLVRLAPGPVFSENLLLLSQAGRPVLAEPATLAFVSLAGSWDEQPYVSLFERRYFRLLVVYDIHDGQRYTPAVESAIEGAYLLWQRVGPYSLYCPRNHPDLR